MSTLKQFRQSAANALEEYIAVFDERTDSEGLVRQITTDELTRIYSKVIGYKIAGNQPYYSTRHQFTGLLPEFFMEDSSVEQIQKIVDWIDNNKLQFRLWLAYYNALDRQHSDIYNTSFRWNRIITSEDDTSMDSSGQMSSYAYYKFLHALMSTQVEKQDLIKGTQDAKRLINNYKDTLRRYKPSPKADTGINKIFKEAPRANKTIVEQQYLEAIAPMNKINGLAARTWGFEIEVPDACGIDPLHNCGIEKGEDGSLRSYNSDNCECSCNSCSYHDCNCDNCEDQNDSPDHDCGYSECSQADMAEFRTTGAIQRFKHSGMYDLLKKLNDADAEMNDTAGTHIHVWAGDLTTNQVGQVMAIYKYTESIMSILAGRFNVNYAGEVRATDVAMALSRKNPQLRPVKPLAVNVTHLFGDRGTIEFRQMDCNLDPDKITFWAWLVRGLVEVAHRGATLRDFMRVTDLNDIIKVLSVWNYELDNEHPGEVIPGSRVDKQLVKVQKHVQVSN